MNFIAHTTPARLLFVYLQYCPCIMAVAYLYRTLRHRKSVPQCSKVACGHNNIAIILMEQELPSPPETVLHRPSRVSKVSRLGATHHPYSLFYI
jgi:hypothetical protein